MGAHGPIDNLYRLDGLADVTTMTPVIMPLSTKWCFFFFPGGGENPGKFAGERGGMMPKKETFGSSP